MKVDSLQSTPTQTTATTSGALTGSKDEFLKLFMAQLEHQDPLDPKNGADMVAQLAQFSSVEQAQQTNQHLIDLANAQSSTSSATLSNLVGRDCNVAAGDFQLDHGTAPPIQISSTSAMKGASVVITDDSGKEMRRIAVPAGATSAQIAWDGKTAAGTAAAPGTYHVTVDAGTTTGSITSQWHGRVDAVELTSDGPRLRMGGVLLAPGDVRTIGLSNDISQNPTGAGVKQ
ncbi:MAG TPA: flagellar hook capping FlgD N-terminal domain-containing protein [Kofleriaceae bacterium]|nr:flagellar hook capping FlgD N-terminal domain-containing protein [Kofleriaceae bacterium]